MTIKIHKALCLSILMFLAGCNGDIFVDVYLPRGYNEITLSEIDNSKEINFKSDNWGLIYIACQTIDSYTTNAYTIDGKPTNLPFEKKELGTVHYTSDYIDVQVEKKSDNTLKVILNENLLNRDEEMLITVGNEFKEENIKLLLSPTQKYRIDSVVYDWDKFETHEGSLKEMEYLTVNNQQSSLPLTITFFPFKKSAREINFHDSTTLWEEEVYSRLLGTPLPEITIPDVVDAKPVLHDTKVAFGIRDQHLSTNLDKELAVDVTIDGFSRRKVIVYNKLIWYSVPYKIYLSNPKTGKELIFTGKLYSEEPIDYLILKQVVDEN